MKSISSIVPAHPIARAAVQALSLLAATTPFALAEDTADPARAEIAELRQQVQDLTKLVRDLQQQVTARPAAVPAAPTAPAAASTVAITAAPPPQEPDLTPEPPADPLPAPKRADLSIFNPEISVAIDAIGSYSKSADKCKRLAF